MTVEKVDTPAEENLEEESNEDFSDDGEGLFYVPKKALDKVSEALEKKQDISKEMIKELLEPEDLADEDIMVPVDVGDMPEFQDSEKMIEELGAGKAAEVFVNARKKFVEMVAAVEEGARDAMPKDMTFKEYKECMEEEEGMEDGESEEEGDADDDDEDEEDGEGEAEDGEADGAEPTAKKQKTG